MNPGLPILDASYNKKQNSKGAPTPTAVSNTPAGLPVLDASFNEQFKKKVGGVDYGTDTAPIESESSSVSQSVEPTNPTSFLSKDIDQSQSLPKPQDFTFEGIAEQQTAAPAAPSATEALDKQKKKDGILSEPEQLKDYSKNRVNALNTDINRLQNELQKYQQPNLYLAGSPGAPINNELKYGEGAQPLIDEIAAKKKYLDEFKQNVQNVAAYSVVSKENLNRGVSDSQLKSIGAKYLETINDSEVGDDREVIRMMDATDSSKEDAERSLQNVNYKFYKTGANAVARYYGDVAEDAYKQNSGKIDELRTLLTQQQSEKDQAKKLELQPRINELMQDQGVKEYVNADSQKEQYIKKSQNASDQFPQVKRQQIRQQLMDAAFTFSTLKNKALDGTGQLLNWIFGDQAREEDVPVLAKMTGIPQEEIENILKSDIKGYFSGADDAGLRIPGLLTGIAQSADQTIGSMVMGTKRFLNTDNAGVENRVVSDRMKEYNMKAQKAKLYDDYGKLNLNPYSVSNQVGIGIGQTAIYAFPSMVTGGLAAGLAERAGAFAAADKVGKAISMATTTGSGFTGSFEDAYVFAGKYTTDEQLRRAYATKVGLANGLAENLLEPAALAKKVGVGQDAFESFAKTYKSKGPGAAIWDGIKEFGEVIGTENIEEISTLAGEDKAKEVDLGIYTTPGEFMNNAAETVVTTTLTTLPLGIGAGINGTRDQSNILKQGLFEAGNEPDLYKSRLKGLLDNGTINQDQYNERASVVNTMAQIVPSIKPTDIHGNKLSYEQKAELAAQQFRILNNNKILESKAVVEAEKPLIEADNKDAIQKQTDILTGVPTETPTVEPEATKVDENAPEAARNALLDKIKNIESKSIIASQFKENPEEGLNFIQEQATGMTSGRETVGEPTYDETVKMFGEDLTNQAVSILPQEQKDMILAAYKENGIEPNPALIKAIQSSNINDHESENGESNNQETGQTSEESNSSIGEEAQDVLTNEEQKEDAAPLEKTIDEQKATEEIPGEEAKVAPVEKKAPRKKIANIQEAEEELKRIFAPSQDKILGMEVNVGEQKNTADQYLKKADAVLKQLYPKSSITTYDTADEYYQKEKRPVGSAGVFHPDGRLALNMQIIRERGAGNTIFHEVIHPIVNEAIVNREGVLDEAWENLKSIAKSVPEVKQIDSHIAKYANSSINIQRTEGIVEFLTKVADGSIDVSKIPVSAAAKIVDLVNKIFKAIGVKIKINNASDLGKLSQAIKQAFDAADAAPVKDVLGNRKTSSLSSESFDSLSAEEQEKAVKDFIKRSKGLDENELKTLLKKYTGWSDEKINPFFDRETGITHAQTSETAEEFGFKGYEQSAETFDEWDEEALKKIKEGFDVPKLVSQMANGKIPTAVEQRIIKYYLSNLEAEVEKDPSDLNLAKLMATIRASDIAGGRLVGQSLVARKGAGLRDDSLAAYFVREQEDVNNGEPLSDEQKQRVQKEYRDIQAAKLKLEEKTIQLEKENARLRADKAIKSQQPKTKVEKKAHADYVKERSDIVANIREKLKQARSGTNATILPYANELIAIAPDVLKLTRSLIQEGVSNLGDIVGEIHAQLKDSIDGLTEKDIHDIIAGDYNQPKPSRSEVTKQLAELRTQAKRENEEGKKNPKDASLAAIKTRTQNQIKELEGKLKTGDYQEAEIKKEPTKLDKEAIDLKDKLIKLRQDREIRIMQHKYENRSRKQKIRDRLFEFYNVPRTLMASMDFSAPLRQAIIPTVSHPLMAAKAGVEMFKQSVSQKRFDRWFHDLKQSPNYNLIEQSGLYVADPHDPRLSAKEEAFMNNLAEKIPILGKLVKGSERAYVGYLNKMRVDLFNRFADNYESEGFTFENSPELYKGTASMVNNFTGRGGMGPLEAAAPVLNGAFFSPRLMASRWNILGLSDAATLGNGFYGKMPQKVRVEAWKDIAKFVGTGVTLLSILALAAAGSDDKDKITVEADPRSTDFGKIRSGNTRWDIWGGFQPYVRALAQLISGEKKSSASGNISNLDGKGAFGETRGGVLMRFVRGKLAPIPSTAYNLLEGSNLVGEPFTWKDAALQMSAPLIFSDLKAAIKDRGVGALFTVGLPSTFGVGVQTQTPRGYENVDNAKGVYKTLYDNSLNLTLPPKGNMDEKQYKEFVPAQQKIFSDEWDNVIKYGAQLNENGGVTIDENKAVAVKPFEKLTHDEKTSLMQSISQRATREAKKEIGFEEKKEVKNQEYINQ